MGLLQCYRKDGYLSTVMARHKVQRVDAAPHKQACFLIVAGPEELAIGVCRDRNCSFGTSILNRYCDNICLLQAL